MDAINGKAIPFDEYQQDFQSAMDEAYQTSKLPSEGDEELLKAQVESTYATIERRSKNSLEEIVQRFTDLVGEEGPELIRISRHEMSLTNARTAFFNTVKRFITYLIAKGYDFPSNTFGVLSRTLYSMNALTDSVDLEGYEEVMKNLSCIDIEIAKEELDNIEES